MLWGTFSDWTIRWISQHYVKCTVHNLCPSQVTIIYLLLNKHLQKHKTRIIFVSISRCIHLHCTFNFVQAMSFHNQTSATLKVLFATSQSVWKQTISMKTNSTIQFWNPAGGVPEFEIKKQHTQTACTSLKGSGLGHSWPIGPEFEPIK
jgi:hypothetical protein